MPTVLVVVSRGVGGGVALQAGQQDLARLLFADLGGLFLVAEDHAPVSCCSCVSRSSSSRLVASSRLRPLSSCSVCRCRSRSLESSSLRRLASWIFSVSLRCVPSTIFSCLRSCSACSSRASWRLSSRRSRSWSSPAQAAELLFAFALGLDRLFLDFQLGLAAAVLHLLLGAADDLLGFRFGVATAEMVQQRLQHEGQGGREHRGNNHHGGGNGCHGFPLGIESTTRLRPLPSRDAERPTASRTDPQKAGRRRQRRCPPGPTKRRPGAAGFERLLQTDGIAYHPDKKRSSGIGPPGSAPSSPTRHGRADPSAQRPCRIPIRMKSHSIIAPTPENWLVPAAKKPFEYSLCVALGPPLEGSRRHLLTDHFLLVCLV